MLYDFNFYSSILLVMFLQVLVYSILLLKKGIETKIGSNYWLCLFVFVGTMYVAPWILGFAGWYDNQPYRDFMFMCFSALIFGWTTAVFLCSKFVESCF